jgi:RNA polymerase sigma-70 factor (ECF subfamily)
VCSKGNLFAACCIVVGKERIVMVLTLVYPMQQTPHFVHSSYGKIGLNYLIMSREDKKKPEKRELSSDRVAELVRQSREGDVQAMEALYEFFKTPLFSLAIRYTYNFAAAEDVIQDTFVKAFTNIHSLDDEKFFVRWLYRIAVNTCFSYLRSHKKWKKQTIPLEQVKGVLSKTDTDSVEKDTSKSLEDAIQSLSSRLKSVFILHDVQGFKHREVAQILGCSVGTSKSQLFKARMKIREFLENKQLL